MTNIIGNNHFNFSKKNKDTQTEYLIFPFTYHGDIRNTISPKLKCVQNDTYKFNIDLYEHISNMLSFSNKDLSNIAQSFTLSIDGNINLNIIDKTENMLTCIVGNISMLHFNIGIGVYIIELNINNDLNLDSLINFLDNINNHKSNFIINENVAIKNIDLKDISNIQTDNCYEIIDYTRKPKTMKYYTTSISDLQNLKLIKSNDSIYIRAIHTEKLTYSKFIMKFLFVDDITPLLPSWKLFYSFSPIYINTYTKDKYSVYKDVSNALSIYPDEYYDSKESDGNVIKKIPNSMYDTFIQKKSQNIFLISILSENTPRLLHLSKIKYDNMLIFTLSIIQYYGALDIINQIKQLSNKNYLSITHDTKKNHTKDMITSMYEKSIEIKEMIMNYRLNYYFGDDKISRSDFTNFIWQQFNHNNEIDKILNNTSIGYDLLDTKITSLHTQLEEEVTKRQERRWKIISVIGGVFATWSTFSSIWSLKDLIYNSTAYSIFNISSIGFDSEIKMTLILFFISVIAGIIFGLIFYRLFDINKDV